MRRMLECTVVLLFTVSIARAQDYQPTWESLDKRPVPQWYKDAKFGIFIHWGVYSVPGFRKKGEYAEWYQNGLNSGDSSTIAYHKKKFGDLTYYQLADQFKAELFNPDEWARLIEQSGARYVVLTSKHHDGFALWPSKEASRDWGRPWNAMDAGPHRDLLGDLFAALRKTSVHPGLYYSLYEWYNPIWLKDHRQYVDQHMWPQMKDVINTYRPDIFWTDGEWEETAETWKSKEFLAWLYNESPVKDRVVTYDRWGAGIRFKHGGVYTPEYQPDVSFEDHYYEESRGMGMSYGYNRNEDAWDYNSDSALVLQLVDKVSGGGNFLLDIGPDEHGKIPPIMEERLIQMGEWMKYNHEAIYNTVRWRVPSQGADAGSGAGATGGSGQENADHAKGGQEDGPRPGKECYFTYNPTENNLYVILPQWHSVQFVVKDLTVAPGTHAELLETHQPLEVQQQGNDLVVLLPDFDPGRIRGRYAYVIKLAHTGAFAANAKVQFSYPGRLLKPLVVLTAKDSSHIHYTLDGSTPDEGSPLYTKPFFADRSATLTVRTFRDGMLPGNTVITPVTVFTLLPAAHPAKLQSELKVAAYELETTSVSGLDHANPVRDTVSASPSIKDLTRPEQAGLRYTGYIRIGGDGIYTWYLAADDGAVLWIDGRLVVDNDGQHANTEKEGKIALKKGLHIFKLDYIQGKSDKALKLEYSVNGHDRLGVSAGDWGHE